MNGEDLLHSDAVEFQYEECAKHLGLCCIHFQQLEEVLSRATGFLCNPADWEAGEIITAELSFRRLCDLASSMFKHWNQPDARIQEWDKLISNCLTAESKRNQLIHSTYGMVGVEGIQRKKVTAKYKKGRKEVTDLVLKDDLVEFARYCDSLSMSIHDSLSLSLRGWHDGSWAAANL